MLCLGHHRDTFQHVLAFNIVAPVLTSHVEFARDHGFDSLADSVEHQPRVLQVSNLHAYMSQHVEALILTRLMDVPTESMIGIYC